MINFINYLKFHYYYIYYFIYNTSFLSNHRILYINIYKSLSNSVSMSSLRCKIADFHADSNL